MAYDSREISRRHHTEHPLAKLTDDELHGLVELDRLLGDALKDGLAEPLAVMATLAFQEANDREYCAGTGGQ